MNEIDEDTLQYLDSIASIVAGLQDSEYWSQKLGEPHDEYHRALSELGSAYMIIYNLLLNTLEK